MSGITDEYPRSWIAISLIGNYMSKGEISLHLQFITSLTPHLPRLVQFPLVLSFKQILSEFDQVTAPITLVCAGNRRKEQNQVRKSNGFSWGAAGVSTALFTGPLMASILKRAKPLRGARYLCMEGADRLVRGTPKLLSQAT